jgi:Tol biopolymer transport system component/DNA-binding winged helix-turn-helix (wHTH) protein
LQSQPFKLLATLLEHPGEVVLRETLQQELWGADTTVDFDHGLGMAVNKLRDALGDSAENPRFVETLSRRGYRFIAPVAAVVPQAVALSASTTPVAPAARKHIALPWLIAGALTLASVVFAVLAFSRPASSDPHRVAQVTFSGHVLTNDPDVESFSSSATDGTRIYFSHLDNGTPVLAVALVSNGEISHIKLPSAINAPLIGSLSPDGSKLVVRSHLQTEPEQPLWIVPTLGGNARRMPNVLAHDATWMPDGLHLLIASGNDLSIIDADGGDQHRFATLPGLAFWMRWSPNGRLLRFTLRDLNRQTSELWEIRSDGTQLHPLLPDWSHPASECCGSWTPDGRKFVFQSYHNGHSDVWIRHERPWYLGGSGNPHQITNGPLDYAAPATAPDGEHVYFIGSTTQFELLRAVPGSPVFTALDQNLSAASLAQFSPDGQWVAWLNAAENSLWRSRIDGTERIELTTPPLRIFTMKWSPDNYRLAVMAEEPGRPWKIYLVDADGGKLTPILNEDRNEADPSWTPDGKSILFGRPPDRMDGGQNKAIYLLNLETQKITEIPHSEGLFSPRLSPDGRYIAALPLDQHSLLLFDRITEQWSTLTTHGAGDPTWSHDGRYVYFQDFLERGKPVYRISVPEGKPEAVVTIGNLRPTGATDYRLIGLAPGDLPIVTARTPAVNLYDVNLNKK